MKNLKTIISKTEKSNVQIFKKDGTLTRYMRELIQYDLHGKTIRPVSYRGSGRYITKKDDTVYFTTLLKAAGYKYEEGNDAPRGGLQGNYIKISKRAADFLKSIS